MSEDRTKDIEETSKTAPTIETVLERINALAMHIDNRFEALEIRLDRIESEASKTRSEMLALRADFRELRAGLNTHA